MFKKVFIKIILEQAIMFEERAYNFYQSVLSWSVMKESEGLLKKLLVAELKHRMKLDELQKKGDLKDLQVTDDAKVEGSQEISSDWPLLNPWSARKEILQVALQKEMIAYKFYKQMAMRTRLKAVSDTFTLLSNEEAQHIQWIQEEIGGNEK
jgi:rubrerythrin